MGQGGSGEKGENSRDELIKGDQARRLVGTEVKRAGTPPNLAKGGPSGSLAKTSQGAREGLLLPLTHDNRCVLPRRCRFRRKMIF